MTVWNQLFRQLDMDCGTTINGVRTDSRLVQPGDAFVALRGGSAYIDDAIDRGAVLVVAQEGHRHVHVVDDTIVFLQRLVAMYRQTLSACVVGITGSVGKTSLTQLLAQSLVQYGETVATAGNENNEIGVAQTLLRATSSTKFLVIEMGVAKPGDMCQLRRMVMPDVAIVTGVGPTHLQDLGNKQGVWAEKSKIFGEGTQAIVNADCVYSDVEGALTFGRLAADCQIVEGVVHVKGRQYAYFEERILHRLYTYAAAHALYLHLDLAPNFEGVRWPSKRLETIVHHSGAVVIDDCYNASYVSYIAALSYVKNMDGLVVVLGEMGGLGHMSGQYHRLLGHVLNHMGIASVLMVGRSHRYTLQTYMGEAKVFEGTQDVACVLKLMLKPGVCVLLKGSRHLALEEVLV